MSGRIRVSLMRGATAGVAGALGLAVVLSLAKPPPTEQQRRAVAEANASLAESGVTPVGSPIVTGGSVFDDPAGALVLAAGCVAFGVGVGLALGLIAGSSGRSGSEGRPIVAVVVLGYLTTVGVLALIGRLRGRELAAFAVFWVVTGIAAWFSPAGDPATMGRLTPPR